MKLLFHKKKAKPIIDLLIDLYIDRALYMLTQLDINLGSSGYIYIIVALDIYLGYIFTIETPLLEAYFLSCLKIVVSLYDDIIDGDFSLEYISEKININVNILVEIQRGILKFYEYDFFGYNLIRSYIEIIDNTKCKLIAEYIKENIYNEEFLIMDTGSKIETISKYITPNQSKCILL